MTSIKSYNFPKEPSTGRIYSTDNENYLGVESLFSSTNYWVNMQVCYDGMKVRASSFVYLMFPFSLLSIILSINLVLHTAVN